MSPVGRRGVAVFVAVLALAACRHPGGPVRYEGTVTVLSSPGKPAGLCWVLRQSNPPQCTGLPVVGWSWASVHGAHRLNGTTWGEWHVIGTYDRERFTLAGAPTAPRHQRAAALPDFSPACASPEVVDPRAGGAQWEAMSQDFGKFEIRDLVTAWTSAPGARWKGPFVGNVVVRPGAKAAAVALVRRHYAGALCVVERDLPTDAQLRAIQQQMLDRDARAHLGLVVAGDTDPRRGKVVASLWVAGAAERRYAQHRWGDVVELHGVLQPVT